MSINIAYTGECVYEDYRLKYQIIDLEFIKNKFFKIEVVCFSRFNEFDREAIFKYSTSNLNSSDERLKVAMSIFDSIIKNIKLEKNNIYKLCVRDKKIYYITAL